jgi:DMSO/TMAO reductase YedYZ heme-binding membrane subunit
VVAILAVLAVGVAVPAAGVAVLAAVLAVLAAGVAVLAAVLAVLYFVSYTRCDLSFALMSSFLLDN